MQIAAALSDAKNLEFIKALDRLENLTEEPVKTLTLILQARCYLGIDDWAKAEKCYKNILKTCKPDEYFERAEAELILGQTENALKSFHAGLQVNQENGEAYFLNGLVNYKTGRVVAALQEIRKAIENNFEWEDDDPADQVVQHTLALEEFHDFEHLYLDIFDELLNNQQNPQNRWLSINIPIYEFYTEKNPEKQLLKAYSIAQMFSSEFDMAFLKNGKQQLQKIIDDFAKSETDAHFGLEAKKLFQEEKYQEISNLVLAMVLEHLKEFSHIFALKKEIFQASDLQGLVRILPLQIARSLMFLYASSAPEDQLKQFIQQDINIEYIAGLTAAGFITFYNQIDKYKKIT